MPIVHLGSESEYIAITFPESYTSEGWAKADVEIAVNCFRGHIQSYVEAIDIVPFTKQLRSVYETLKGEAAFIPREKQFTLRIVCVSGGHLRLSGEAWSRAVHENKLGFQLVLDQSFLPEPLSVLEGLAHAVNKNES